MKYIISAVVFLLAFIPASASAFSFTPTPRFDHACLTTDGSPQLAAALDVWSTVSGVTNCGVSNHPDIRLKVVSAAEAATWGSVAAQAGVYPKYDHPTVADYCLITSAPLWANIPHTVEHEMGHCFGLGHSDDKTSLMYAYQDEHSPFTPSADDVAAVRLIFPLPQLTHSVRVAF